MTLALTGYGRVLHVLDPASQPGQPRTLCGRPNACIAAGYGTLDAPREGVPTCTACFTAAAATAQVKSWQAPQ